MLKEILPQKSVISLIVFWVIVLIFQFWGSSFQANLSPVKALIVFSVLLITIIMASFKVVHEADQIAHKIGEPFGTLILTLSIVIIEVVLIVAMLFGPVEAPEIAKDSVFSVMMIILNLVIGLSLFVGGKKYGEQAYNSQGTLTYLSMIMILGGIGLLLPSFIAGNGEFTAIQAVGVSVATIFLYGFFLKYQLTDYSYLFKQPRNESLSIDFQERKTYLIEGNKGEKMSRKELILRIFVLIVFILPIVLLSHNLGFYVDYGISEMQLPTALGGILIAIIVFTPESITAVKAALSNELQRTINLCHGAFVSTVGLTIPAVLLIGLLTNKSIILGLTPVEIALFMITLVLNLMTFSGKKTTPFLGLVHLVLFFIYILFVFNP